MKQRITAYIAAKKSKVGDVIACPGCFHHFKKKSYNQKFCRRKGGTVCKDRYYNKIKK